MLRSANENHATCPSKAHSRECLGIGGRRVQVSRHWSGKTLREHRADRAEVVRQVLEGVERVVMNEDPDRTLRRQEVGRVLDHVGQIVRAVGGVNRVV